MKCSKLCDHCEEDKFGYYCELKPHTDLVPFGKECENMKEVLEKRIFSGVWPTGIGYSDRKHEEHGDYKKLAHLSFETLEITWYTKDPELVKWIQDDAGKIQARKGEQYQVSQCAQYITLGYGLKS